MRCCELEAGLAFLELCLDEWKKRAPVGGITQANLATMERVYNGAPSTIGEIRLRGPEDYNIWKGIFSWVVGKLVIND